jgi:hypothetical protein
MGLLGLCREAYASGEWEDVQAAMRRKDVGRWKASRRDQLTGKCAMLCQSRSPTHAAAGNRRRSK